MPYRSLLRWEGLFPLCEGRELFELIKMRKSFTKAQTCTVLVQVLGALVYLHARGIVHHNLKPENIWFCRANSDELKVIDFRLSKTIFDTSAFLKSSIRTSYYFVLEALHHKYKEKSDVWSCGVILHCMLVGFPPIVGAKKIMKYWRK
jgi:calcium-dependent protein kinase